MSRGWVCPKCFSVKSAEGDCCVPPPPSPRAYRYVYGDIAISTASLEGQGYRRVYQGGHHDVWCNDELHVRRMGAGYASETMGSRSVSTEGLQLCNCAEFAR